MPDAVISQKGDWIEPFHALYSKDLAVDIKRNVENGIYKIHDVLKTKNVIRISEGKVREFSPDLDIFTNLFDMADLERFFSRLETGVMESVLL